MSTDWIKMFVSGYCTVLVFMLSTAYKTPDFYIGYISDKIIQVFFCSIAVTIGCYYSIWILQDHLTSIPSLTVEQLTLINRYCETGRAIWLALASFSLLTFMINLGCLHIANYQKCSKKLRLSNI